MSDNPWYLKPERHCAGTDPEMWMPNKDKTSFGLKRLNELRRICKDCPVRDACFQDALRNCALGFQAGYSANTLRGMRKEAGIVLKELLPCSTNAAYMRHLRYGEKPCEASMAAHRLYVAEGKARRQLN